MKAMDWIRGIEMSQEELRDFPGIPTNANGQIQFLLKAFKEMREIAIFNLAGQGDVLSWETLKRIPTEDAIDHVFNERMKE